jgi:hypothetical protein
MRRSQEKDLFSHFVIAGGAIAVLILLISFFYTLSGLVSSNSSVDNKNQTKSITCKGCITQSDTGKKYTIKAGSDIKIELPENIYRESNILILSNPQHLFGPAVKITPSKDGMWAVSLRALTQGIADITVHSSSDTVSDFYISVTVQ